MVTLEDFIQDSKVRTSLYSTNFQGLKFMVTNVQFATGLRTFAPKKKKNLGANLLLQLMAHFHNNSFFNR